jgi:hypothetical protein
MIVVGCLMASAASGELGWPVRDPGAREKGGKVRRNLISKEERGAHRRDGVTAAPWGIPARGGGLWRQNMDERCRWGTEEPSGRF